MVKKSMIRGMRKGEIFLKREVNFFSIDLDFILMGTPQSVTGCPKTWFSDIHCEGWDENHLHSLLSTYKMRILKTYCLCQLNLVKLLPIMTKHVT